MGRHFLQIPGPSPEPDAVLQALSNTTIDHRGPQFQRLAISVTERIRPIFQTSDPVIIYSGSGTGAWEAALVNTLSPGDEVLFYASGHFATMWSKLANRLGLKARTIEGDWRQGIDTERITESLLADDAHRIRAVCCVHNETSTGVTNNIGRVREAIDAASHPALLLVDTISGVGSADYRHDEWGVDVSIGCSQKGLMLPPGLGLNAVSAKAIEASAAAKLPRSYWDWKPILEANAGGFWPTTPSTNLLFALEASLDLFEEETLPKVFDRHQRLAEATRAAVNAWGLELVCTDESSYSPVLTAIFLPEDVDADAFRGRVLKKYNMSLGAGLGKLAGKAFRIGHLGWTNELTILGAIAGVEMELRASHVDLAGCGVSAAMEKLS